MFTARYGLSSYTKQILSSLKGLIKMPQHALEPKQMTVLFRTRMQAAQHGGDNEQHKSRQLSVMENFYRAVHRDTATCNENSAACVSKIRDTKNYFYLLQRYGKFAISYRMTDNILRPLLCLNKTDRQCTYQRNNEVRPCNICCSGRAMSITSSQCVFVALSIQHVMRARCIVTCGLPGCTIFWPYYLIKGKNFEKKNFVEHTGCVLICYTTFVRNFFHS